MLNAVTSSSDKNDKGISKQSITLIFNEIADRFKRFAIFSRYLGLFPTYRENFILTVRCFACT